MASLLDYWFDSDWKQRGDINRLREEHDRSSANAQSAIVEMRKEVTELAATVRVLMRKLAEANLLDVTTLKQDIADELRYKGPSAISVVCSKCGTKGMSNEMVKLGSDWMCRPCAKNP